MLDFNIEELSLFLKIMIENDLIMICNDKKRHLQNEGAFLYREKRI